MPDVQAKIQLAFEILGATLESFALVDADQHADLVDACGGILFGSKRSQVEALMNGSIGRPTIPVTTRGTPQLSDCWERVSAAVDAYNALGTGLRMDFRSLIPNVVPRPHCAEWQWVDDEWVLVVNWSVELTTGGQTDPVFRVSEAASVSRQVMAMGHAAIRVPIG